MLKIEQQNIELRNKVNHQPFIRVIERPVIHSTQTTDTKKPPNPKAGGYCNTFNIKCYSVRLLLVLIVRYV